MGCAIPGYPTVYARVSEFMPWIKHVIMDHPMPTTTQPPTTAPPSNETIHDNNKDANGEIFWNLGNTTDNFTPNETDGFVGNVTEVVTSTDLINSSVNQGFNITAGSST